MGNTSFLMRSLVVLLGSAIGAALGSGCMCFLMRRAKGETWNKERSHCELCGHLLRWSDLIPIYSYFSHHGRCKYCGSMIPQECIISEVIFAVFGAVISLSIVSDALPTDSRVRQCVGATLLIIVYVIISKISLKENQKREEERNVKHH